MKKEIFTWILAMFTELMKIIVIAPVVIALILAFGQVFTLAPQACHYHCVTCENAAKTESGNELHVEGIITEVWVKAGQGCYVPDDQCYTITDGGIGFDFVVVEKVGDGPECQDISHIEVCYEIEATPTDTPTATSTETSTPTSTSAEPSETPEETHTNTPTSTYTPTVENTETPTDPVDTDTPEPTKTDVPTRQPNGNGCG